MPVPDPLRNYEGRDDMVSSSTHDWRVSIREGVKTLIHEAVSLPNSSRDVVVLWSSVVAW